MDSPLDAPRFCLQPTAANTLGHRLLSGSVRLLVIRDGDGPSRAGPRLFEAHRALEAAGLCLWLCPRGELIPLLSLARRYGFEAEPPALFWRGDASDWLLPLRRAPGLTPLSLPAVVRERDEPAELAWARMLSLAEAATLPDDPERSGRLWVVEPDAPDTEVAEVALGLGHSWLGRLQAANDDGEPCAWMRRLAATGAKAASAVPQMLGPDVPRATPGAIADLFPEARQPAPRKARKRRAAPEGVLELPIVSN